MLMSDAYSPMNLKQQMTKKEKILTVILVGILVAYGWYQVAYGTNESDYKYGYKDGLGEYHHCFVNHICAVSEDINTSACDSGGVYLGFTPIYRVGNETACNHGHRNQLDIKLEKC